MNVLVELYGIPRQRAGLAQTTAQGVSLGDVLTDLAQRFPALAEDCLRDGRLQPGVTANLSGNRFISDPDTPLADGDTLLLLSADAGG